jgi:hypothetical protein
VPGHGDIEGSGTGNQLTRLESQDLNQHVAFQQRLPRRLSGWKETINILGVDSWTQRGKQIHPGTLCQKKDVAVKIRKKSFTVDGWTTYRALSPERTPL